ncbi:MAG: ACP S-malonyltransferase [Ruminococcaceae bacterium]|nr:ACP S-malonyltransferase [Oscillospiraceae bacterium]
MKKKVAMFPGQGSIYVGMGKKLCENHELARRTFEEASDAISVDMKKLCFTADLKELTKTENSQPAILTASVAAYRVLQETTGFRPHYFAGHSLGEFSALTCAKAIDFADAVTLVKKRGELMRDASGDSQGLMTAVGKVPKQKIIDICSEISASDSVVCVSNYNSLKQNVISGHKDAVIAAEKRLADLGASVKRLNVSAAFHSPLMQPALEQFKIVLNEYSFRQPEGIVLSNVTARPHTADQIAERMAQQLVSPVRWQESMEYLKEQKIRLAVDVGPGKVLRNLMFDNFPNVKALTYDASDDANELIKLLENEKTIPFISRCMGLAVATKNLCNDAQVYEANVVEPYRQLQLMQETVDAENRGASEDEMRRAKQLLLQIFNAKKVPANEQEERLQRLYLDTETESLFNA